MKKTMLTIAIVTSLTTPAHAAFYVDEDAPQVTAAAPTPTSFYMPPPLQVQRETEVSLDVTFVPSRSKINIAGRKALTENLEEIRLSDEIKITTFNARPANVAIQRSRGNAIKQWLIRNGIPASKILVIEGQNDFTHNQQTANVASLTLVQHNTIPAYVSTPSIPRYARLVRSEPIRPSPAIYQAPQKTAESETKSGLINDKLKLTLVQKIIAMSQNKIVKPEDAVNMMAEILKMQDGAASSGQVMRSNPTSAPIVAVTMDLPRTWTLDHKRSLRENVEDWAKIARWETPVWNTTIPFEIAYSSTVTGTYLDALGQLANAVPSLDFKANRSMRTLTVMDSQKK